MSRYVKIKQIYDTFYDGDNIYFLNLDPLMFWFSNLGDFESERSMGVYVDASAR
jgi:hypothetical protein